MPLKDIPTGICERIIDFCYDDKQTLARSTLVCRAWLPRSRAHLFRAVNFSTLDTVARFKTSTASSSSLLDHVRDLHVGPTKPYACASRGRPDPSWLQLVGEAMAIPFPRLQRVTITHCLFSYEDSPATWKPTFAAVEELNVHNCSFSAKDGAAQLVLQPFTALVRLSFRHIRREWPALGKGNPDFRLPTGLLSLDLYRVQEDIVHMFNLGAKGRRALEHIAMDELGVGSNKEFIKIVRDSAKGLRTLAVGFVNFSTEEVMRALKITPLPSLKRLTLYLDFEKAFEHLRGTHQLLSALQAPSLRTLIVRMCCKTFPESASGPDVVLNIDDFLWRTDEHVLWPAVWEGLDRDLAAPRLAGVIRVQFVWHGRDEDEPPYREVKEALPRRWLPTLEASGRLRILHEQ